MTIRVDHLEQSTFQRKYRANARCRTRFDLASPDPSREARDPQAGWWANEEERTPYRISAAIVQLLSQRGPKSRADLWTMSARGERVKRRSPAWQGGALRSRRSFARHPAHPSPRHAWVDAPTRRATRLASPRSVLGAQRACAPMGEAHSVQRLQQPQRRAAATKGRVAAGESARSTRERAWSSRCSARAHPRAADRGRACPSWRSRRASELADVLLLERHELLAERARKHLL